MINDQEDHITGAMSLLRHRQQWDPVLKERTWPQTRGLGISFLQTDKEIACTSVDAGC